MIGQVVTSTLPHAEVSRRLDRIEAEDGVRVVYAVESGSRAWGFASADSDFDVRFLYVHRPAWYLRIERARDVIEWPIADDFDLAGWDLRKALGLFYKSNPALHEWLRSPLVYHEVGPAAGALRDFVPTFYDPRAGFHHYLRMAESNFRSGLERDVVRHKKYLYVLRPALACLWIDAEATAPPMEFEALLDRFLPSGGVRDEIDALVAAKRISQEADAGPRLPAVHDYLVGTLDDLRQRMGEQPKPLRDVAELDRLLVSVLKSVWPGDPFWRVG